MRSKNPFPDSTWIAKRLVSLFLALPDNACVICRAINLFAIAEIKSEALHPLLIEEALPDGSCLSFEVNGSGHGFRVQF